MKRRERGFTLLEVVIAFAIAASSLTALYEALGQSGRRFPAAEADAYAWLALDSLIDALGSTIPLPEGSADGTLADSYRYQVTRVRTDSPEAAGTLGAELGASELRTYRLSLSYPCGTSTRSIELQRAWRVPQ